MFAEVGAACLHEPGIPRTNGTMTHKDRTHNLTAMAIGSIYNIGLKKMFFRERLASAAQLDLSCERPSTCVDQTRRRRRASQASLRKYCGVGVWRRAYAINRLRCDTQRIASSTFREVRSRRQHVLQHCGYPMERCLACRVATQSYIG